MSRVALAAALALMLPTLASAAETLHVYGPGGPMPAMKEAAIVFGAAHGITVEVTAGPTPVWIEKARTEAKDFAAYLASADGAKIFTKRGWITSAAH